jgi:hypothetical protein
MHRGIIAEKMIREQPANDFPRMLRAFAHLIVARIEAEHDPRDRSVEQSRGGYNERRIPFGSDLTLPSRSRFPA